MAIVNLMIPHRKDKGGWVMTYTTGDGFSGSMHRSPSQFTFENVAKITTQDREGMKPITYRSGLGLRTLSFTQILFHNDYTMSIEPLVARLAGPAARGTRIRFAHGSPEFENGRWWLITGLSVKVAGRAKTNAASRVQLDWTLTEYVPAPNPATTVKKPAPAPKPAVRTTSKAPVARYYRVANGDTLWAISARFLGSGARWAEIYRLNTSIIRNPNVLTAGMNLRIPGR